eukprot:11216632-Lingulodinium_polyedra.AAC.1
MIQMTRAACGRMGRFWWTVAPERLTRQVYIPSMCRARCAQLRRHYPLTEIDTRRYDTVTIGRLRAMMSGKA